MAKDEHLIEAELLAYIRSVGGTESDWFVAVAESARECLFEKHGVVREDDRWIYRKALNAESAKRVVDYFRNELGTDGVDCGENGIERLYVCVYRKSDNTNP